MRTADAMIPNTFKKFGLNTNILWREVAGESTNQSIGSLGSLGSLESLGSLGSLGDTKPASLIS
jgi:hypothetical protein